MLDSYDVLLAHPGLVSAYLDRPGGASRQAHRVLDDISTSNPGAAPWVGSEYHRNG